MNATDIAATIQYKKQYKNVYPTKSYQDKVLSALGVTAQDCEHADQIFEALGLKVGHKRAGRTTVPVVKILPRQHSYEIGGWNAGGEDGWSETVKMTYPDVDFAAIMQFVEA